ncbi:TPA: hypothetical protein ACPZRZ_003937 [Yersinia enterocolitica]|uniref:hypothetical protein n=1 Tax=Yersinia enterocolitica TaxID=630 RepID=UPI0028B3F5C6|nr:hypothetical protein [Yersinia enterocolitica]ELI7990149.1 hypothetical protein [Yersinia enterocolitica]
MNIARDIANILINVDVIEIDDNFNVCTISCNICDMNLHHDSFDRFEHINALALQHNLEYDVMLKLEDTASIEFDQSSDFNSITQQINEQLPFYDKDLKNTLTIKIFKRKSHEKNNITHIFDLKSYLQLWDDVSFLELLTFLNSFDNDKKVLFKSWEFISDFNTSQYYFTSDLDRTLSFLDTSERKKSFEKRNKSCHFTNDSEFKFNPDDFFILIDTDHQSIKNKFKVFLVILTIIYLSDFSEIITNSDNSLSLEYKMKGYRLINNIVAFEDIDVSTCEELYFIYQWVYNQGNFVDKVGLARNIISIHMLGNDITSLSQGTLKSIESGYDIYLKDNVKQYIEIKNKISELLIAQTDKASDITKNMFATLKTSFWSIVTFFITVILVKLVATKDSSSGIISGEIFIVTLVFITFSFVYLFLTNNEVGEEKKRLFDRYDTIKLRYKDLLNEDDLNKVIDTSTLRKSDGDYIDKRKKMYTWTWIGFNLLTLLVVFLMYCNGQRNNSTPPLNSDPAILLEQKENNLNDGTSDFLKTKPIEENEDKLIITQPIDTNNIQ